jgi:hypothetical protein
MVTCILLRIRKRLNLIEQLEKSVEQAELQLNSQQDIERERRSKKERETQQSDRHNNNAGDFHLFKIRNSRMGVPAFLLLNLYPLLG